MSTRANGVVYVAYCTPTYEQVATETTSTEGPPQQGSQWVQSGMKFFPLIKPTIDEAKRQMRKRSGKGYTYHSLTREHVAELLEEYVPFEKVMSG